MKFNLQTIFIIIALIIILVLIGFIYFYFNLAKKFPEYQAFKKEKELQESSRSSCLKENEIAEYKIIRKEKEISLATIIIKDREANEEVFSFQIELPLADHYHPIELHKCGVYAIKYFNYDHTKSKQEPGFRKEIWKYTYDGTSKKLFTISEVGSHGDYNLPFYGDDFRIDNNENFIGCKKIYLAQGQPDYALVIKKIENLEDVFILSLKEIVTKYPELEGNFGFNEWTKDGKYFWGNVFIGADVVAFFRIERDSWKYEIFKTPEGTMGGDALNPEQGYVTYDDGPPWTGDLDLANIYQEQWKKEGKVVSFFLYNLLTKEKLLLATTTDTLWNFNPKWLSEKELEYYLPSGERKVFILE